MKFIKAEVNVIKFNINDIITTSGGGEIASCSVPGKPVEECDFGG